MHLFRPTTAKANHVNPCSMQLQQSSPFRTVECSSSALGSEPRVPQCDREHAVELVQEVEAAALVQMDERLDVGMAGGCSASRSSMWL